ncbi:MFS transporter [Flavilitoribacter nigricans]|uniref:MFS transporter n=1 Tax=Flavilitoribacter nigricans (strain ATCC 23147 / DSM 23189 / NBRC 102662 / NCIMB 1420 / SS-2) TaxID=1122177 RepID=A0A2D0N6G7_FLAN2|nr:MFS transporter [Flavilitoribacter nigricans]PHN04122.1 MFS transporter [Flavilitoribacter nigricans DSM 23189 = NBRC 102662]
MTTTKSKTFTAYEAFIIAVLTILQFTIILDFMVLSPLSAILLEEMDITTAQFGLVVSAYAFSAGAAGLLAAGFADRFDRKKLLLFFYGGFIIGTFLCGIAPTYHLLLGARIVTGLFGGVIGSVSYAIITDIFALKVRGRVMGFIQMAFATSQVLGIPIGLYLANWMDWHAPFLLIVAVSIIVFIGIVFKMRAVDAHLSLQTKQSPFRHLTKTVSQLRYLKGFGATTLLSTGGFMLMPFGAAFSVNNLGITLEELPLVYMVTGIVSMIGGPIIGRLSDKIGKMRMFVIGSLLSLVLVVYYTNLGPTPLWFLILLSSVLFLGITSRMIASSALITAVPDPSDRGAFMGVNSSVAQVSGGIASAIAGMIVYQTETGYIERYPVLGIIVAISMIITIGMMQMINRDIKRRQEEERALEAAAEIAPQ